MNDESSVTIVDVARLAGVSKTTASDALRGRGRVSPATKVAVDRAADRLGYTPNRSARSLRTATTETIGLHIPEFLIRSEYYMSFVFGVVGEAGASGYDVTMITSGHPPRGGHMPHVDGLVLCDPVAGEPMMEALIHTSLPVVTCEPFPGDAPTAGTVRSDHGSRALELLDHLAASGARRPALFGSTTPSEWKATMQRTYDDWCLEHDVDGVSREVPFASTLDVLRETVAAMLRDEPSIDALVCAADGVAVAVQPAIEAAGHEIGRDFLLGSCVDSTAMRSADPPITAIDTKPRESGAACARLLFDVLAGDADDGAERYVPIELHTRPSTSR
ncbi:LacI family DNA-binding transcriptional regulator [Solicola gregarius]|uniref:LacI family transcriptional regulator n=1 Tax=Solicola gregarius TaxID=2908642 RepID=A0AA46TKJ6_9ACTN|nr:LacI family DNA-binding transcriptional regulator [Solicola gregarius]UYM06587.1 LacI family transcriptional regulator [Solicola gregarius]